MHWSPTSSNVGTGWQTIWKYKRSLHLTDDDSLAAADVFDQVTTEEQRNEFLTQLSAAEDWLYMDGADATAQVFQEKSKELEAFGLFLVISLHVLCLVSGNPIFVRTAESVNRPLAVENSKKTIGVVDKAIIAWIEMKPWLAEDLAELAKTVSLCPLAQHRVHVLVWHLDR